MERAVCSSHAQVMIYDDNLRKWLPAENMSGVARVQIYQHAQNNTYRVVGRIVQDNAVSTELCLTFCSLYTESHECQVIFKDP